jgi:hypothetical protein
LGSLPGEVASENAWAVRAGPQVSRTATERNAKIPRRYDIKIEVIVHAD